MAPRDPSVPQSDDPELLASLIRFLRVVGPLGRLGVADFVIPVVNMGDVVTRTIEVLQPSFRSSDLFSAQVQVAAAANTIHADTGQLAAGIYDIQLHISPNTTDNMAWLIEHQNAANTASLALWQVLSMAGDGTAIHQSLSYEFALNERLRISNSSAVSVNVSTVAWIFARRRT